MQRTLTSLIALSFVINFGIFENDLGNGFGVFENGLDGVKKGWAILIRVLVVLLKKD